MPTNTLSELATLLQQRADAQQVKFNSTFLDARVLSLMESSLNLPAQQHDLVLGNASVQSIFLSEDKQTLYVENVTGSFLGLTGATVNAAITQTTNDPTGYDFILAVTLPSGWTFGDSLEPLAMLQPPDYLNVVGDQYFYFSTYTADRPLPNFPGLTLPTSGTTTILQAGLNYYAAVELSGIFSLASVILRSSSSYPMYGVITPDPVKPQFDLRAYVTSSGLQLDFIDVSQPWVGVQVVYVTLNDDDPSNDAGNGPSDAMSIAGAGDAEELPVIVFYFGSLIEIAPDPHPHSGTDNVSTDNLGFEITAAFNDPAATDVVLSIRSTDQTKLSLGSIASALMHSSASEIKDATKPLSDLLGSITMKEFNAEFWPSLSSSPLRSTELLTGTSSLLRSTELLIGTSPPWHPFGDFYRDLFSLDLNLRWFVFWGSQSNQSNWLVSFETTFLYKNKLSFDLTVTIPQLLITGVQSGEAVQLSLGDMNNDLFDNQLPIPDDLIAFQFSDFSISINAPTKIYTVGAVASLEFNLFGSQVLSFRHMQIGVTVDMSNSQKTDYTLSFNGIIALGPIEVQTTATISNVQQTDIVFTMHLVNETVGSMLNHLVHLVDPNYDISFGDPWDKLLDISLDALVVQVNVTKGIVSLTYDTSINLEFIDITGITLTYTKGTTGGTATGGTATGGTATGGTATGGTATGGTTGGTPTASSVTIALDATFFGQSFGGSSSTPPLGWDAINGSPPSVPGTSSSAFDLQYLGLGQHIAFQGVKLTTVEAVMKALSQSVLPSPDGKLPPFGQNGLAFSTESNWLIGAQFSLMNTIAISAIFNDPNLYGILIKLSGEKAKVFAGLSFEILYRKINDTIGVYHMELKLPDAMRNLQFGEVSLTLPVVILDIYTNGNFRVDFGFPIGLDFSNSFSLQVFPFVGFGGFYFALLDGATSSRVPQITNGNFAPVVEFGVALSLGVGKTLDEGILKGGISITVVGILQGVLAWFNPTDNAPQDTYYWFQGTISIVGKLYATIDFAIIQASVDVTAYASVTLTIESYQPIYIALSAGVSVSVSVKIVFFTIHFSFSTTVNASFTIGSATTTPWQLGSGNAPGSNAARQMLRGQRTLHSPAPRHAGYFRALRRAMVEKSAPPPITNWPAVCVLPQGKQTVTVWALPAFTQLEEGAAAILLLAAENSIHPNAATLREHRVLVGADPASATFNLLLQAMLGWGIHVKTGGTTVKAHQLEELRHQLEKPETIAAAFDYTTLKSFLEQNFIFDVSPAGVSQWSITAPPGGAVRSNGTTTITTSTEHGFAVGDQVAISGVSDASFNGPFTVATVPNPTTFTYQQLDQPNTPTGSGNGMADAITGVALFPMIPDITLSDNAQTSIPFNNWNNVDRTYQDNVRAYFQLLQVQFQARNNGSKAPTDGLAANDPSVSMATAVFSQYFNMLMSAGVKAAIDLLAQYPYTPQTAMSIADVGNAVGDSSLATDPLRVVIPNQDTPLLNAGVVLLLHNVVHQVRANETFATIASSFQKQGALNLNGQPYSITDLLAANGDSTGIFNVGTSITFSGITYTTQAKDTLNHIGVRLMLRAAGPALLNAMSGLADEVQALQQLNPTIHTDPNQPLATQIAPAPSGAVRASDVVTITTTVPHNLAVGQTVTVVGVTDNSFDGTFTVASTPSATSFTYQQSQPDASSGNGQAWPSLSSVALEQGGSYSVVAGDTLTLIAGYSLAATQQSFNISPFIANLLMLNPGLAVKDPTRPQPLKTQIAMPPITRVLATGDTINSLATTLITTPTVIQTSLASAPATPVLLAPQGVLKVPLQYKVAADDTFSGIAARFNLTLHEVAEQAALVAGLFAPQAWVIAANSGAARVGGSTTITTTVAHGLAVGDTVTIGGVGDPTFNGQFTVTEVTTSTFTYLQPAFEDATSGNGTAIANKPILINDLASINVQTLMEDLLNQAEWNNASGMVSRFLLSGLRLPDPKQQLVMDDLRDSTKLAGISTSPLFALTGQQYQIAMPLPSDYQIKLQNNTGDPWLTINSSSSFAFGLTSEQQNYLEKVANATLSPGIKTLTRLALFQMVPPRIVLQNHIAWQAAVPPAGCLASQAATGNPDIWLFPDSLVQQIKSVPPSPSPLLYECVVAKHIALDAPVSATQADCYAWATIVDFTVSLPVTDGPTASVSNAYVINGADDDGAALLQQVYSSIKSPPAPVPIAANGAVRQGDTTRITTSEPHGLTQDDQVNIAGVEDASFNGQFTVASVPNKTTFTYTQPGQDTAASGSGTATIVLATLYLLYAPNPTSGNPSGLTSDQLKPDATFILKTNLSTLTHSGGHNFAAFAVEDPTSVYAAPLADPADFIALLWEASVTRSGGFYLNYVNQNGGAALPTSVFGNSSSATLSLLIVLNSQDKTKDAALLPFNNCVIVGDNIDTAVASLFVQPSTYTVQADDSLTRAHMEFNEAWRTSFKVPLIAELNKDVPLLLQVGAQLTLPGQNTPYTIEYGDTLASIAKSQSLDVQTLVSTGANATSPILAPGAQMQFADGILQPATTVPPGTVGFEITRANPDPDNLPFDQLTAAQMVGTLFNLVGFSIAHAGAFTASGEGLPTTPANSFQAQSNGLTPRDLDDSIDPNWYYHQTLAVAPFGNPQGSASPALPGSSGNPYNGVGYDGTSQQINQVTLKLNLHDTYGNIQSLPTPWDKLQVPVGYYDDIVSLGSWPSLAISYLVSGSPPQIDLNMTMQQARYIPSSSVPVASALAAVAADLASYTGIYYQLVQPDLTFGLQTTLDLNSMASQQAAYPLSKTPFLSFAYGAYLYLAALDAMKAVQLKVTGDTTSVLDVMNQYGVTVRQLFDANKDQLYSSLFGFGSAMLAVPRMYSTIEGDSLASSATRSITPTSTPIAAAPGGAMRSDGVTKLTTATPHGLSANDSVIISRVTDNSFDGTFTLLAVLNPTTFTYQQSSQADATSGGGTALRVTALAISNIAALNQNVPLNPGIDLAAPARTVVAQRTAPIATDKGAMRAGGVTTITTTTPHNFDPNDDVTIADVTDNSFNGRFTVALVTGPTTFTYQQLGQADASSGNGTATAPPDSLNGVAARAHASVAALAEANAMQTNILQQGIVLAVGTQSYQLGANDSFNNAAQKLGATVAAVATANQWLQGIFVPNATLNVTDVVVMQNDTLATLVTGYADDDLAAFATTNAAVQNLFAPATTIQVGTNSSPQQPEATDTLSDFALKNNVTVDQLANANDSALFVNDAVLDIPGILLNTASHPYCTYTAGPSDTLASIATKFHKQPADITALNPDIAGLLSIGQTITDTTSGHVVQTSDGDTFDSVITLFQSGGASMSLAQLAADVATQQGLVAPGSLWICPSMLGGANGINSDNSLNGLMTAYNTDVVTLATSNAAAIGFLAAKPNQKLTLFNVEITMSAYETLNSLVNRLAEKGVSVTVADVADHIATVPGLINPQANVVPIPPPSPASNGVTLKPKFSDSDPVFQIAVNVISTRNPNWVDPDFAKASTVSASVYGVIPEPDPQGNGSTSFALTQFATRLQEALPGLQVATGAPLAEDDPASASTIWGVNFRRSDGPQSSYGAQISYKFLGEKTQYFALPPLSTSLMGRTVGIRPYVSGQPLGTAQQQSFQAIDLDVWLNTFLQAVDVFLAPAYAVPAYALAPSQVVNVVQQKQVLAEAISSQLQHVLQEQDGGSLDDAKAAMYQALLAQLSSAFTIETVVQVPVNVTSPFTDPITAPLAAPRLSGKIASQPQTSNGVPKALPNAFSFSTAKVALTAPTATGTFLFSVKTPAHHKEANLHLEYVITEIELPNPQAVIGDYEGSSWLKFILPLEDPHSTIGDVNIPIPLRSYPSPVTLISQTAQQSVPQPDPDKVGDLLGWDFSFVYQHDDAEQDTPFVAIAFNTTGLPQWPPAPRGIDLNKIFAELGQFMAVYPTLKDDLALLPLLTPGTSNANALAAVEAFSYLVTQVAAAWTQVQDSTETASVAPSETYCYQMQKKPSEEDSSKLDTLTITSFNLHTGQPVNPTEPWPEVYATYPHNEFQLTRERQASHTQAVYQYPPHLHIPLDAALPQRFVFGTNRGGLIAADNGATRSNGTTTITTTFAHGLAQGDWVKVSGVTDSSFNGLFTVATVPDPTTFTYVQTGKSASSGNGTANQSVIPPGATLAAPQQFEFNNVNILAKQHARAGVSIARNLELVGTSATNPAFVYQTPFTDFTSIAIPSISDSSKIPIGSGDLTGIAEKLGAFLENLLTTENRWQAGDMLTIRLAVAYSYPLAISSGGGSSPLTELSPLVPITLIPSFVFDPTADWNWNNEKSFVSQVQAIIAQLAPNISSSLEGSSYVFDLTIYGNQGPPQALIHTTSLSYALS